MDETLLLQKEVDKSVLFQGLSIPDLFQKLFCEKTGLNLAHGERCQIKIMLDGTLYDANLVNQPFDQKKYPGHPDVLQIRYSENSLLAQTIRNKFLNTNNLIAEFRSHEENRGKKLKLENSQKEYIVLYATPEKGTIFMDCINNNEFKEEASAISKLGEVDYEVAIDSNATILIETVPRKVRRLSKAIGNSLKLVYGFRCQICGQYIGAQYGSNLIHAHHIDYFTKSMNNNSDNIMIVCPNHHGIIHDKNPEFDRKTKTYKYPNGYVEGLKLNYHL